MKALAVLFAALVAAVAAQAALAQPLTGGNKPPKPGSGCKPMVAVVLQGSVAVAPPANPTLPVGLQVTVLSANAAGAAYVGTTPVTVIVTASTKLTRKGPATLSNLLLGDIVTVKAKACQTDLAGGATPTLTAGSINAKPATKPKQGSEG